MESRRWLMARMTEIGLAPSMDGIGNVYGRHGGPGPHALVGSHIESQNQAGWLDGALGVVAGLALARAGLPVDVCAYADEEGHFEGGFLGSRSLIGVLTEEEIDRSRNRTTGEPLRDALAAAGLAGLERMQLEPGRHKGAFELHIEQGRQLETAGLHAGVVTGIVAIWQLPHRDRGPAGPCRRHHHGGAAGCRPGRGAVARGGRPRIPAHLCGALGLDHGAHRPRPRRPVDHPRPRRGAVQFRDISVEVLQRMEDCLRMLVRESNRTERCTATLVTISRATPALCDPAMMQALGAAAEAHAPGLWQEMPSGAGHDSQYLALKMPVAMLFTPSINGISHHWLEDTHPDDLALCCQILADGAARFLAG